MTPVAPLPLKVFVISAGALRAPFKKFLGVIVAARAIRYFGLAWLGIQLGENAPDFLRRDGWTVGAAALFLAFTLVLLRRWTDARRRWPPPPERVGAGTRTSA